MRFSKLVSGISSLAIAASAFAGIAVTANAAETTATVAYEQDFDSTDGLESTTVTKTTKVDDDGNTEETISGVYLPSDYGFEKSVVSGAGYSVAYVNGVLTIDAISDKNQRGLNLTHTFTQVGAGNEVSVSYTWATGSATGKSKSSYSETYIADTDGNKVFDLKYYGQDNELYLNGNSVATNVERSQIVRVTATIDMNKEKVTTLSVVNNSSSTSIYTLDGTLDFADKDDDGNAKAAGIGMFGFAHVANATGWCNTSYVDDISITYTEAKVAATSGSITYKCGDETIYTESVNVDGKYVGDTWRFQIPKYYIKDSKLYQATTVSNASYYTDEITVGSDTTATATVKYTDATPDTGEAVYFGDFGDTIGTSGNTDYMRASGGAWGSPSTLVPANTLSDGVYTITINHNRNRKSHIYVGDTLIGDLGAFGNAGVLGETTFTDVTVKDGAAITATVNTDASTALENMDYILVTRTGDIPITHDEAFTFDMKTADLNNDKMLTVKFKNNSTGTVSDSAVLTEKLTSETTYSGVADASIAVIITDIADGYSVSSITIE